MNVLGHIWGTRGTDCVPRRVDSAARPVVRVRRLGRHRWVVERTLGWLLFYKRLALRYDRTAVTITALARLAVILICARRLPVD